MYRMSWVLPSSKYNVERSAGIGGGENQFPAMVLFDDASRERQTDAPAALLCRESGLEDAGAEARRDARPVVGNTNAHATVMKSGSRHANATATTGKRVDRILGEHLDRPLEQHGITIDRSGRPVVGDIDCDRVRERRDARTKISSNPIDEQCHVNRLTFRVAANAFKPMRNAIESFEICAHVSGRRLRRWILGALLEQLDPPGETREWRTQLMRRFASHPRPNSLARDVPSHTNHIEADDQQDRRRRNLQDRNDS